MKIFLLIIIAIIILTSCEHGVNINIQNKTSKMIDSIFIQNDFKTIKIKEVDINKNLHFFIDFTNNKHRGDGIFSLYVYKNGIKRKKDFGYYSNGIPPNNNFKITVYKDIVKVEQD